MESEINLGRTSERPSMVSKFIRISLFVCIVLMFTAFMLVEWMRASVRASHLDDLARIAQIEKVGGICQLREDFPYTSNPWAVGTPFSITFRREAVSFEAIDTLNSTIPLKWGMVHIDVFQCIVSSRGISHISNKAISDISDMTFWGCAWNDGEPLAKCVYLKLNNGILISVSDSVKVDQMPSLWSKNTWAVPAR